MTEQSEVVDVQEYVTADRLMGGLQAAEGASDFKPPTDQLLALRPLGHKMVTAVGVAKPFDAVEVYTVAVGAGGVFDDLGVRDVAWQFVIRELDKATDEAPWIVGTVVKKNAAYFLTPPTADDMKMAAQSIASLLDHKREQEAAMRTVAEGFGLPSPEADPVAVEEPF
jgi:hypothetical protein